MTELTEKRDASGRLLDRRVMCLLVGTGHLARIMIRTMEESGVTGIVMVERERPKQEMVVALTPLALPTIEPLPAFKDQRPYWRRLEKRKRT